MDNPNMPMQGGMCKCPHHKVIPLMAVLLGAAFLAGDFGWLSASAVSWIWPVLVIIAGGTKLGRCKCC